MLNRHALALRLEYSCQVCHCHLACLVLNGHALRGGVEYLRLLVIAFMIN